MVKAFTSALLGVSTLLAASADAAYPNPGACSGVCVNTHDPALIRRSDGTYFRFSTGGGIAVHSAPDISGPWTYKGAAIQGDSKVKLSGYSGEMDEWAPDIREVGGKYYLYYSAVRAVPFDGHNLAAVGVATSSSMDIGTWTDHGSTGITSNDNSEFNAIDQNLFEENGQYYMIFGSYESGIYQSVMKNPPTKSQPNTYAKLSFGEAEEGPVMFSHGSYNYLFFSQGQCCSLDVSKPASGKEYKIQVCRSKPGSMDFRDKSGKACVDGGGTTVLASHGHVYAPGGQGVYNDPTYGPVVYYHYVDTRIGYADGQKQFGWNKLDFSSGWPVAK